MHDDIYSRMIIEIIAVQEAIMGPLAIEQANSVEGLTVDWSSKTANISTDPQKVIEGLINKYRVLFGDTSVEVSREAVSNLIRELSAQEVPSILRG